MGIGHNQNCGYIYSDPFRTEQVKRIHGGIDATCGEHPWQASIRLKGEEKSYHWCGASIISQFHVITAAHCMKDFSKSAYLVRVGDCDLDIKGTEEAEHTIDEIIIHENFNEGPYLNNDIALVKINGYGITFGQQVKPVCLPSPNLAYPPNLNLTITGWGKVGYDSNDAAYLPERNKQGAVIPLQKADVPILRTSLCTSKKVTFLTW